MRRLFMIRLSVVLLTLILMAGSVHQSAWSRGEICENRCLNSFNMESRNCVGLSDRNFNICLIRAEVRFWFCYENCQYWSY